MVKGDTIGGEDVIMTYYNPAGQSVSSIDVFGNTGDGNKLERVNTLKSRIIWFIFVEFFPNTDVNRIM